MNSRVRSVNPVGACGDRIATRQAARLPAAKGRSYGGSRHMPCFSPASRRSSSSGWRAPTHLAQDGWLALVAGRIIAAHGIPSHDYVTVMAYGVQLGRPAVARSAGDLRAAAGRRPGAVRGRVRRADRSRVRIRDRRCAAPRRRGPPRDRGAAGRWPAIRGQPSRSARRGSRYPLFVAMLWLLASAARGRAGRRVYLVFPLLVLWANLHGSVTLGVALAMHLRRDRARRRLGACAGPGSPTCADCRSCSARRCACWLTPYGLSIVALLPTRPC